MPRLDEIADYVKPFEIIIRPVRAETYDLAYSIDTGWYCDGKKRFGVDLNMDPADGMPIAQYAERVLEPALQVLRERVAGTGWMGNDPQARPALV